MASQKIMKFKRFYLAIFLLCVSAFAQAQQNPATELPLSEEALNLFSQTLFLSTFASENCEDE
jgi:hypothetical protein